MEAKRLHPEMKKFIDKGTWPMFEIGPDIKNLVRLRQKYLALCSRKYGLHSIHVEKQLCN